MFIWFEWSSYIWVEANLCSPPPCTRETQLCWLQSFLNLCKIQASPMVYRKGHVSQKPPPWETCHDHSIPNSFDMKPFCTKPHWSWQPLADWDSSLPYSSLGWYDAACFCMCASGSVCRNPASNYRREHLWKQINQITELRTFFNLASWALILKYPLTPLWRTLE